MKTRSSALCIALLAMGCSEGPPPSSTASPPAPDEVAETPTQAEEAPTKETPVTATETTKTLLFADGSGNQYLITSTNGGSNLVYTPVTPENSSSGTYSGGEPVTVSLSAEKTTELWERVQTLQSDTGVHAGARGMGTGSFKISGPDQATRFLVKMGTELSAFDEFVQGLRKP